jgi:hypothetical protein
MESDLPPCLAQAPLPECSVSTLVSTTLDSPTSRRGELSMAYKLHPLLSCTSVSVYASAAKKDAFRECGNAAVCFVSGQTAFFASPVIVPQAFHSASGMWLELRIICAYLSRWGVTADIQQCCGTV